MAAGLGFKTFVTGEVLTSGDVNGYLMQGINVFTNATARDAAITAPAEGQFAFTKDNNSLWYYDGAAWVASGATGDIEGVTAGVGISGGGTSGTVTVTNSMATAIDAKGDLVPGTGADTFARLAVGANNTVLTADSAEATGLKWATPAGGAIKQIVNAVTSTGTSTSSTTYIDVTGLSATITPSSASSKVLVTVSCPTIFMYGNAGATTTVTGRYQLTRGGTAIGGENYYSLQGYVSSSMSVNLPFMFSFQDSPATTSAITYKLQVRVNNAQTSWEIGTAGSPAIITLQEI